MDTLIDTDVDTDVDTDGSIEQDIAAFAFAWLEEHDAQVDRLCWKIIGRSRFPFEEAKSECVIRCFNAVMTCDFSKPGAASLSTHILGTLRFYLIKLIYSRTPVREAWRKTQLFEHTTEEMLQYNVDYGAIEDRLILEEVLSELDTDDSVMLELRYIYEEPLDEIMNMFDCSRPNACQRVHRAVVKARKLWDRKERKGYMNGHK